jgi:uncharacterized protein YuzE
MAALAAKNTETFIGKCVAMATGMLQFPIKHIWLDYDKEADVLYMSFRKPQRAKKTIEFEDGILVRKDGKEIVGLTILNASGRQ